MDIRIARTDVLFFLSGQAVVSLAIPAGNKFRPHGKTCIQPVNLCEKLLSVHLSGPHQDPTNRKLFANLKPLKIKQKLKISTGMIYIFVPGASVPRMRMK